MSGGESVRVLLRLARMKGDDEPVVIAAVDETVWEHWNDADEAAWRESATKAWGIDQDTEWREVWVEFAPDDLRRTFDTPTIQGHLE